MQLGALCPTLKPNKVKMVGKDEHVVFKMMTNMYHGKVDIWPCFLWDNWSEDKMKGTIQLQIDSIKIELF